MSDTVNVQEYYAKKKVDPALCTLITHILETTITIAQTLREAPIRDLFGSTHKINVQGEDIQKLDVFTNTLLSTALQKTKLVAGIASEEEPEYVCFESVAPSAPYVVCFDPLDGSSNIETNAPIGTIFSILHKASTAPLQESDFLQPITNICAAGYVIYGPSTQAVLSCGSGVQMFTLTKNNVYLLHNEYAHIPEKSTYFSANVSTMHAWDTALQHYVHRNIHNTSLRYSGSLVTDIHRILTKGGIFLYPSVQQQYPEGKLRVLFEILPIAYLILQAQGMCYTQYGNIQSMTPTHLHQRAALYCGSPTNMKALINAIAL